MKREKRRWKRVNRKLRISLPSLKTSNKRWRKKNRKRKTKKKRIVNNPRIKIGRVLEVLSTRYLN